MNAPPPPGQARSRHKGIRERIWVGVGLLALAAGLAGFGIALVALGSYRPTGLLFVAAGAVPPLAWAALLLWRLVIKPLERTAEWAARPDPTSTPEEANHVSELAVVADAVARLWSALWEAEEANHRLQEDGAAETQRLEAALSQEREAMETLSQIARIVRDQADAILETMDEGIVVLDDQNMVMVMNHSAAKILEVESSWIGRDILKCRHVYESLPEHLWRDGTDDREWQANLVAGDRVVVASGRPIESSVAPARLLVLRDITVQAQMELEIIARHRELQSAHEELELRNEALKQVNARLEELSVTDDLTGLPNTRKMREALDEAIERQRRKREGVAFLMLDIDHFKEYNDTFGHLAGDRALQGVSVVLQQCVRILDTPARYGGEEFAVIVPDCNKQDASRVAERIRQAVERHEFEHGRITISIGIAGIPEDAEDAETLIRCADEALYSAKRQGRNRVVLWTGGRQAA
jgi:diguanylate cyclase (GGDEF)-like protein